ncbi:hypothetical protein LUZ60_002047 [Juncus effusus]|nr:hypothetical protein LUZ60_002047 [Juncus effusus]
MNGSFNSQILVDKLAKLNNTQQSIETLSHWCIFHRNKARQVVDTWEKEFRLASRDRKISFLYLANDILQNSRRKGMEFIAEFWRVLPGALLEVVGSGNVSGRNAALRLVDIWEERKVFGSRGQTLKEDLLGKTSENRNKDAKEIVYKSKKSGGEMLEKLVSSYDNIHSIDEENLYSKCQTAVSFVDKTEKDVTNKSLSGDKNTEELEAQQRILRECIEGLKAAKLSRNNLINFLKEALVEQELKIQRIDNQLQVAQTRSDQANKLLGRPTTPPTQTLESETLTSNQTINPSETLTASEDLKSAAAAVAAKLAASTCSAQMLSLVFSSLASSETLNPSSSSSETLNPNPSPKRPKLDTSYVPAPPQSQPEPVPPPPPFPPSPSQETGTGSGTGTGTVPAGQVQMGAMSAIGPMGGMVPWPTGSGPMFMPPMMVPPQFLGGPGPYQGFHGPTVGPNQASFAPPALPPLSRP